MKNSLRTELHNMIDNFPEERLQEVYEFLNDNGYSNEMKEMLDGEYNDYLKTGEVVSKEEVDRILNKLLARD